MKHHFFSEAGMKSITICMLFIIPVFQFLFVCTGASEDLCDPVILKTTNKKSELAYRRFSNRCEGFYGVEVANPAFKVVGLTMGTFTYKMDSSEIIKISVPNHRNRTINIRSEPIPSKTYYRMDTVIVGDQKLEWPVKDILLQRPIELASGKIGLIGWIEKGDQKVFLPVLAESSTTRSDHARQVRLCIGTSSDLAAFKWRAIISANDGSKLPGNWNDPLVGNRHVRKGQSIIIQLNQNATGLMYVEFAARIKNTRTWIKDSIKLDLRGLQ